MKLLSIVICTYNGEKHIEEVVESVLRQENVNNYIDQILIVDNASDNNTTKICKDLSLKHDLVNYVYEEKSGLSYARKHATSVKTEWITYLDDDNVLRDGWLNSTIRFISDNPKLGICNCASIAFPEEKLTKDQEETLYAIAPGLACTHDSIISYESGEQPLITSPFGAGMTLRTEPLKKYLLEGWTKSIGREKNILSSGEDGEIARAVLRLGYEYKYNQNASLLHIIPLSRLQPEYIKRLTEGLDAGSYQYISTSEHYIVYRIGVLIKYSLSIMIYPIKRIMNTGKKKERIRLNNISHKNIVKMIIKNGIFRRL